MHESIKNWCYWNFTHLCSAAVFCSLSSVTSGYSSVYSRQRMQVTDFTFLLLLSQMMRPSSESLTIKSLFLKRYSCQHLHRPHCSFRLYIQGAFKSSIHKRINAQACACNHFYHLITWVTPVCINTGPEHKKHHEHVWSPVTGTGRPDK